MAKHSAARRWSSTFGLTVLATVLGTVLALIVGAEIASASNVGSVSFAGASQAANATTNWTIGFSSSPGQGALSGALGSNKIFVTFDSGFVLPPTPTITLGTGFTSCTAAGSTSGPVVTVTLSGGSCALPKKTAAQLTIASITNPAPCDCPAANFTVSTSGDTTAMANGSNVVILGPASQLAFTTPPGGGTSGIAFGTQPVVAIQDSAGHTITGNTSSVSLAITTGTGPAGAALTCTANPKAAVAGVVSFAGCKIDKAGSYALTATDGSLASAVSTSFTVGAGTATKVVFSVQPPATATAGTALTTFQAAVQDANGNTVSSTDTMALSIASGPTGASFAAGSTPSVAAVAGVATFSNVKLNTVGTYTFTATDTSRTLTTATSSPATIVSAAAANKLAFVLGPADASAGSAFAPAITVQVQDQFGNPVAGSGVIVTLSSSAGPLDAGATATTDGTGLATFNAAQINTAATGLTLTAAADGLTSATSGSFNVVVPVTSGTPLTDVAADSGSGVQGVSYYYCTGYVGTCTNGTLIGTATSAANSYLVTWTSLPANGQYRLVAVATDNVTNASSPSASIPIRIG